MSNKPDPSHHHLRCKRDDGSACTVDLTELEEALNGFDFLEYGTLSLLTIPEIENRIHQTIRQGDIALVRHGDLPLIALTPEGWFHIQPWAYREEVRRATMMNESRLKEIVRAWRNRPRDEQVQLLEALKSLSTDQVSPVLEAWREVSGKDIRARIEQVLDRHQSH